MQQLMYSFIGTTPPPEYIAAVRSGQAGAFCLFEGSNARTPAQLRELTDALRRAAQEGGQPQPIIGIDQEGGQLIAIAAGATELPGNMALGAARSPELAHKAGLVLGRELLAMGVNMNFAPVLDVNNNPENPVIGIRSFGDSPALAAELGVAMIHGMQQQGVIATAKHFPGHGDTAVDSHVDVPVIRHAMQRLDDVELVPFRAAIREGVGAIMTAHVLFTELDDQLPASISPHVTRGLLRRDLGYSGIIITDAMDMQAVSRRGAVKSVREALAAGADVVMLGNLPGQLDFDSQLEDLANPGAIVRIRSAQDALPAVLPSLDVVGCAEHRAIAAEIAERSITVVKGAGQLPLDRNAKLAVITVKPVNLTPADTSGAVTIRLADSVRRRVPGARIIELPYGATDSDVRDVLGAVEHDDIVIVGTIAAEHDPSQAALVRELHKRGQRTVVAALRTPYDLTAFPDVDVYLCTYGIRDVSTEAAARVLFGEIQASGVLPCAIPGVAAPGD